MTRSPADMTQAEARAATIAMIRGLEPTAAARYAGIIRAVDACGPRVKAIILAKLDQRAAGMEVNDAD